MSLVNTLLLFPQKKSSCSVQGGLLGNTARQPEDDALPL